MWKYILALLIPIGAYAGGYYSASKQIEVREVPVDRVVTVVKEKIVTRTVTKTIVRKPDGTVIETVTEEDKEQDKDHTKDDTESGTIARSLDLYRVGVGYRLGSVADAVRPPQWDAVDLSLSRRVAGPFWIDVGGHFVGERKDVILGVSVSW
jgi:hypothetical protein